MAPKVCVDSVYSEAEIFEAAPRQSRRIGVKISVVQKAKDRCQGFLDQQLVRVGCHGNSLPPVGQNCVVMKGTAGKDEGQMGIVTGNTRAMVEVTYVDETTGKPNVRLKRPKFFGDARARTISGARSGWLSMDPYSRIVTSRRLEIM
jgi:hypothetical protein